jgi:cystathionine beta-synthase
MEVLDTFLDAVGRTPMVRLNRVAQSVRPTILAKLEMLNPGGSVKDRIGVRMIDAAERAGLLKPGGTIVEPTSGNTGHGLAIAAAIRGYRCIFVMPDKMSQEKVSLLRAYGAEVVITPTAVAPESPESYYRVADRLTEEIPGAFQPNQYFNQENPRAHYETTGPEIWEQTGGRIDAFVCGVGTGGTITGAGGYLKERNPGLKVIAVEPVTSAVLSGRPPGPHKLQGIGAGFVPPVLDRSLLDEILPVDDEDALETARLAARREGVLCGISSGAALFAALEISRRPEAKGKRIAVVLPDSGERYVSTPFFAPEPERAAGAA